MKIGLVGLGDIAQKAYLPLMAQLADIELVLCTRDANTLRQLARQYRISETTCDFRELPSFGIDAAMIHAATPSHAEIAQFFLRQRLPLFVDKPLADSAAQCEQLYELAQRCNQPLYVGFNRRHLPLLNEHLPGLQAGQRDDLRALRWEKHRHDLAGDARTFVFDDFIHALDSVNLYGKADLDGVHVTCQSTGDRLARVDIQWQSGETLLQASMNRQHGATCERVSAALVNESYEFESLASGRRFRDNRETRLALPDWTPMLASKGFAAMIDDWIQVARGGALDTQVVARNIASHRLAELLCAEIQRAAASRSSDLIEL